MAASRPVAEGLFTWPPEEPRLIGARCTRCGLLGFPAGTDCQRCGGSDAERELLPAQGTLWTFTTQGFRPPSPPYDGTDSAATFQPYAVGYVELADEILVEGRLTEPDPGRLTIGRRMDTTLVAYSTDPDGTEVMTFAFAPADTGQEA